MPPLSRVAPAEVVGSSGKTGIFSLLPSNRPCINDFQISPKTVTSCLRKLHKLLSSVASVVSPVLGHISFASV